MNQQKRDDLEKAFINWIEQVSTKHNFSRDDISQISNISVEIFGKNVCWPYSNIEYIYVNLKFCFFKGSIDDLVLTNCGLENELENLHDKYNELVNKFTNKNNDQAVDEVMIDTLPHML